MTNIIDPDRSIYGAEWGISEDEFISRLGNPTGYIRLNGADTVMLYGKNYAFIFTACKLSESISMCWIGSCLRPS